MTRHDAWGKEHSPFHKGEKELQHRVGRSDDMEKFGRRVVRPSLPDQHRHFYAQLPFLVVGSVDQEGWPWATLLSGKPGFIASPDATTLAVTAVPAKGDPLNDAFSPGAPLGLLGIDLSTRRRNRVNVRVSDIDDGRIGLSVDQAFGNCPQYIQTRDLRFVREPSGSGEEAKISRFTSLDAGAQATIRSADTFFVSSYVPKGDHDDVEGVDVSHRGGKPGFVRVDGNTLTIPDYAGNLHFNTLGNFVLNPKAGLVFVDFDTGDLLMLTGTVEMLWDDDPEVAAFKGAERAWRFTLDHGVLMKDAVPLRWSFGEFSPNSLITGDWHEAAATIAAEAKREEWRPYRIVRIDDESSVIRSFYLEPADGDGVPAFKAGQHLTIRVTPDDCDAPVIRTYTLSSSPEHSVYRISVKREAQGLVSRHLHDALKEGDVIDAKAPRGDFTIDAQEKRPAVLLAAGVGVTPMISMARHVFREGFRTRNIRPLTILHAAQTTAQRAFAKDFWDMSIQSEGAIRYFSFVDRPEDGEKAGRDFNGAGRITADALRQILSLDDYDFFLCGPGPFMQGMYETLRGLGVRDARIFAEAFGPAALDRRPDEGAVVEEPAKEAEQSLIKFVTSGFEQRWSAGEATILETAEAHGLTPEFGCRNGACGSCAVKLISGEVAYRGAPTGARKDDDVLICCAVPAEGSDTVEVEL